MKLTRAIPAGMADAGLASLATFILSLYAIAQWQDTDATILGIYFLYATARLMASTVPRQLVLIPAERMTFDVPAAARLALFGRIIRVCRRTLGVNSRLTESMVDTPCMEDGTTPLEDSTKPDGVSRLAARVASLRPAQIAIPIGVGIGVFVVLGILQRTLFPNWLLANLDSEASAATPFSVTLLGAAALSWGLVALVERPIPRPVLGWAALLGLLAADEGNAFHEGLERGVGIDWQVLYIPVLGLGALLWFGIVRRYLGSQTATLLFAGAGVWAITLVLELVQNWGGQFAPAAVYDPTMIIEEGLEMVGAALMLMAGLTGLRTLADPDRAGSPKASL